MKLFVLLAVALTLCSCFEVRSAADDKVLVELYFESLCPYCHNFLVGPIKKALATKDIWLISDFKLYPYGNARTTKNGTSYSFTCQHGVAECQGNMIEACALNMYDYYSAALPFIVCLEEGSPSWSSA
jgi:interferon gamma-inducible protein 30